jgi:hypothetical protein
LGNDGLHPDDRSVHDLLVSADHRGLAQLGRIFDLAEEKVLERAVFEFFRRLLEE